MPTPQEDLNVRQRLPLQYSAIGSKAASTAATATAKSSAAAPECRSCKQYRLRQPHPVPAPFPTSPVPAPASMAPVPTAALIAPTPLPAPVVPAPVIPPVQLPPPLEFRQLLPEPQQQSSRCLSRNLRDRSDNATTSYHEQGPNSCSNAGSCYTHHMTCGYVQ